jgi:exopolysaccharide biosynthesis polyprenyl glycosylphosphotransferase
MKAQVAEFPVGVNDVYPRSPGIPLRGQRAIHKTWLIVTDALAFGLAFRIAYWMRFDLQVTLAPEIVPDPRFYPSLAVLLIPIMILVLLLFDLYRPSVLLGGVAEYSKLSNACTTGTMVVVLATFMVPEFVVSRLWLVSAWLLSLACVGTNRFITRRLVYRLRQGGYLLTPSAIVGTNQEARVLAADLKDWRASGIRTLGYIATSRSSESLTDINVLGSTEDIRRLVHEYGIEDLIVAITSVNRQQLLQLCEDVNAIPGVNLRLSSGLYELLTTRVNVLTMGAVPLISLSKARLERGEVYLKTLFEYAITILAVILLLPIFTAIALLIKLESTGPVIYRRRVLGLSGRPFDAFKFRTMFVNADDIVKSNAELLVQLRKDWKLKQDPRVTKVGRWLRKFSLDELPQLGNVLLGQMGLVGPRMITLEETEKYGRDKLNLFTVKPGLTGLWQVSGRSDLSYEERVRLDMYYIRNYSIWLDMQILFIQTIPAVLRTRGAY